MPLLVYLYFYSTQIWLGLSFGRKDHDSAAMRGEGSQVISKGSVHGGSNPGRIDIIPFFLKKNIVRIYIYVSTNDIFL